MRKIAASLVLSLVVLLGVVANVGASSQPSHGVRPLVQDCTKVVYGWWGSDNLYQGVHNEAFVNLLYDATTNAFCNEFQAGVKIWADSGTVTVTYRNVGMYWYPGLNLIAGSDNTSSTHYTQGTTPTYFYGNWIGGVPCGWVLLSIGSSNPGEGSASTHVSGGC